MTVPEFVSSPFSVSSWLLCLVRDALENAGSAPLSRSMVAVGAVAWDDCCGMLVVAPESIYRSQEFPTEYAGEDYCWGGQITLSLVVLLVRCVPTVDDRGRPPTQQALEESSRSILADASTVWDAIVCAELPDEWERAGVRQSYVGGEGGCLGIETRVTIGIEQRSWRSVA